MYGKHRNRIHRPPESWWFGEDRWWKSPRWWAGAIPQGYSVFLACVQCLTQFLAPQKGEESHGKRLTPALTYPSPPWCADHTCARSTRSFRKLSPGRQTSFIIGGLSPRSLVLPCCRDPPPAAAHLGIHCNKAPSTAKSSNYKNQKGIKMSIPHSSAFEHQWPHSNHTSRFSSSL